MTTCEAWGLVPVSDIERALEELDEGNPRAAQRLLEELYETASANGLLLNEAPEYRRIVTGRRPSIAVMVGAAVVAFAILAAEVSARRSMAELINVQTALTRFTFDAIENAAEILGYRAKELPPSTQKEVEI